MKKAITSAALLTLLGQLLLAQRDAPPSRSFRFGVDARLHLGAIAVDGGGNVYLTGGTSAPLPATNPEMPKRGNRVNAFVMKFDQNLRPLWTSFVGGTTGRPGSLAVPAGDFGLAIAVDPAGQPIITGRTTSTDFPVVNPFQGRPQATTLTYSDGFVAKLSSDGKRLIYSSYFGERNGDSRLSGVAVGPAGEAWVAGSSTSNEIATHFNVSNSDSKSVIVIKLNPAGGVVWSTRMSGDIVYDFAVDGLGQPHVGASCTGASSFNCSPFIAKLSASGSQQLYRERVGSGFSVPFRMSLSSAGEVVVGGRAGVSAITDPWPSAWGLAGAGFVRLLDASGKTLSSNAVDASATLDPVHVWLADRLLVAFNTTTTKLPTDRPLIPNHVDGPFFTSDDGAATWSNLGGPQAVRSFQIDPERDQLFAVGPAGAYRSDDGGRTWVRDSGAQYFAVDPRRPNIHWWAYGPVFRRVDGSAWLPVSYTLGPSPNTVTTLAVSPHDGSAWVGGDFGVEVVTDDGRAHRFENGGLPLAVTPGSKGFQRPNGFVFDPVDPNVVYVATPAGLYARFGSGTAWMNLTSQLESSNSSNQFVIVAAVDPSNTNVLLIGRRDGMYRSVDRGRTWQQVLTGTEVRTIVPDPNRAGVIYASGHRIFRSLDHGATWQTTSLGYESRFAPSALAINPRTSRLYASSEALQPIAYVMEIAGSGPTYTRSWATYLADGPVFDLARTLSGAAIIGLATHVTDQHSEVTIVQIGQ